MKAAIYLRVSTLEQANGYSLDTQELLALKYCKSNNYEVYQIYSDQVTGAKFDRPQLQALLSDAKTKLFDVVIVHRLDRLARSTRDTFVIVEDIFLPNNISFVSLTEHFDTTTSLGKAVMGILAINAQLELDRIKERMALGKLGRAMQGKPMAWSPGFIPFGYDYIDGQYQVNADAKWVKHIFGLALRGLTPKMIAKQMTVKKILGRTWYFSTIKLILTNPIYIGKIRWRGKVYQGYHLPIISQGDFDAVQKQLDL
ncbi:site-specific DNA recombinase [Streptococcus rupicaprae]|uniref:Site-specific DNA recombinase n=1 Tax=Streptococcus rupicaprae TaxID=759619 RepID=A0ABV2FJJ6_9STRE